MAHEVRVARYLRVSRSDQAIALQDDETAEAASRRGWNVVGTYADHGVSGSRERRPELDRLMNDGRSREVEMSEDVMVVLATHRHSRGTHVLCKPDGVHFTEGETRAPLARIAKRAGLRHIMWHVCRHSFCSHLVMAGIPLRVVQLLAGHTSYKTTERYAHLSPEVRGRAVRVLDTLGNHTATSGGEETNRPVLQ